MPRDPLCLEGRNVVVTRTFSKIYGLAGMRLGYGIAPVALVDRMRPHCSGSINALVKWAGAAALKDTASAERVRSVTLQLRKKTTAELEKLGFKVLPSDTNFFMVHLRRDVTPVIEAFQTKGVLVGRPFPPMVQHLRVSVGTAEEMDRFLTAFREIVARSGLMRPTSDDKLPPHLNRETRICRLLQACVLVRTKSLVPSVPAGMGEVYRAKDTRLSRDVAVKVLPPSFADDPDRLRRFEQEARAAGMLNHPNILAVYDIGSHDGAPYVVSELLEGETLRGADRRDAAAAAQGDRLRDPDRTRACRRARQGHRPSRPET